MNIIAESMPLIAQQAGIWEGEYVHFDQDHRETDRHQSRLICRLYDGPDGEAKLTQSNIYTWSDGSQEIRYFEAHYRYDRLWIQNELIDGWTAPVAKDKTNSSIIVQWLRPQEPGFRYYEMISVAANGQSKNRTWHWYRNNELFRRTLINEARISDSWAEYDDPKYLEYQARE